MSRKSALITGITGQDGSYLADLLLEKGYEVHGMVRRASTEKLRPHRAPPRPRSPCTRATCSTSARSIDALRDSKPRRDLQPRGACRSWRRRGSQPVLTAEFTGVGVTRMLEAMRADRPEARFYQASSLGDVRQRPRGRRRPRRRRSTRARPMASRRCTATSSRSTTASRYGLFRRQRDPLQPRVAAARAGVRDAQDHDGAARIKLGLAEELELGNLDAERDWGYAADYVEAMWLMLQQRRSPTTT